MVLAWAVLLAVVLTASRAIALAERCGDASPVALDRAAVETVTWFEANQRSDGTWLYQFEPEDGTDFGGYNWVRHAGVLYALELAAERGIDAARPIADRGWAAVEPQLVRFGDRTGLRDGQLLTTGGTSLLVVALTDRRAALRARGDAPGAALDERIEALGRFLLDRVEPDGLVDEDTDPDTGVSRPQSFSKFTTGEAMFALARIERELPGRGYGDAARRIGRYLVTERSAREGYDTDFSEHWGAYGFATLAALPNAPRLTDLEARWARRQMWLAGVQIRFDSQRTNRGVNVVLRGHQAPASGIGTVGEALGSWARLAALEPPLASTRGWLADRLACNAGVLTERQATAEDAAQYPDPTMVRGAFLYGGVLRMDDQQHALAAILGARASPDGRPLPKRMPVPESAVLALLVALVAMNPLRIAEGARRLGVHHVGTVAGGVGVSTAVLGVVAVAGGAVLDQLQVSIGSAMIAAGAVLVAATLMSLLFHRRHVSAFECTPASMFVPTAIPLTLRPELLVLSLVMGAGGRGLVFVAGLVVGAAVAIAAAWVAEKRQASGAVLAMVDWVVRAVELAAIALAIAVIAEGVQAI
ncbi:MAG: hypothetical protein AB7L13_05115 [Acidimicrobiia bacterium]